MNIQALNNAGVPASKGSIVKPGKLTNLAYSAVFAASLLGAADCFVKQNTVENTTPKTELKAGLYSDDDEFAKYMDGSAADAIKNYNINNDKPSKGETTKTILMGIFSGVLAGAIAKRFVNEIKYG